MLAILTMRKRIINAIKYSKRLRAAFMVLGSFPFRVAGLFFPVDERRVLFASFGGRKFDDSPRALYEAMRDDPSFDGYEMIWSFLAPEDIGDIGCKKVKIDTFEYFKCALSSRVWITNTAIDRGLNFKKKRTLCVNTWHGTPMKRIPKIAVRQRAEIVTYQNHVDEAYFKERFDMRNCRMLPVDLPRNDALLEYTEQEKAAIRAKLGIPADKKALLYMPTYRGYERNAENLCVQQVPLDIAKWKARLAEDYVLLVRFHHLVDAAMDLDYDEFAINVSNYHPLSDLYAVADLFISDYSSAYFDYSILERPMLCFAYDIDAYREKTGFFVDPEDILPCRIDRTEDDVLQSVVEMDYGKASQAASAFHGVYSAHAGHATQAVLLELKKQLGIAGSGV